MQMGLPGLSVDLALKLRLMQTSIVGGVSVTGQTADAVSPDLPVSSAEVMIETGAQIWESASRKRAEGSVMFVWRSFYEASL